MAVQEAQIPLPVPPTGHDETIAVHPFNPESGHYEPELKNLPLNANLLAGLAAANFIVVTATARPWIYYLVFANTGGAVATVTLTEPGGNTLIADVATVQWTATYTNK